MENDKSLVWNRVRIWRTGRHTPTKYSQEYPPGYNPTFFDHMIAFYLLPINLWHDGLLYARLPFITKRKLRGHYIGQNHYDFSHSLIDLFNYAIIIKTIIFHNKKGACYNSKWRFSKPNTLCWRQSVCFSPLDYSNCMIRPASEYFYFQVGKFGDIGLCRSSRHGPNCSVVDPPDQPLPQRRPQHAIILNTCDANLLFCLIQLYLLTTYRTLRLVVCSWKL